MLKWLGVVAGLIVAGAAGTFWFACPCEVVPGGPLSGERVATPVDDWSFVNDAGLCQMQVDAGIPWSLNLNCMSSDGLVFVSCSRCADKTWSQAALRNPHGYLRVARQVYPVQLRRLTDGGELDRAWSARVQKLGLSADLARPDHWWSFQLTSR